MVNCNFLTVDHFFGQIIQPVGKGAVEVGEGLYELCDTQRPLFEIRLYLAALEG